MESERNFEFSAFNLRKRMFRLEQPIEKSSFSFAKDNRSPNLTVTLITISISKTQ